jgi:N-acetylneuraminic acid mutarotase
MIHTELHRFGVIRTLLVTASFAVALVTGTAVPSFAQGTWTTTGSLNTARTGHVATLLPDGEVLVAGGGNAAGFLPSAELYDPATGKWTVSGSMATARGQQTGTLLPNGEVLVAGGISNGSSCTATAEIYNPSTGQWTTTGRMTKSRSNHTATLLKDGLVLVAGGLCNGGFSYPDNSAELYDPSTGTWKATGSMNIARVNTAATLLRNGQVLIEGGTVPRWAVRAPSFTIPPRALGRLPAA